jgi:hypothetical protein
MTLHNVEKPAASIFMAEKVLFVYSEDVNSKFHQSSGTYLLEIHSITLQKWLILYSPLGGYHMTKLFNKLIKHKTF